VGDDGGERRQKDTCLRRADREGDRCAPVDVQEGEHLEQNRHGDDAPADAQKAGQQADQNPGGQQKSPHGRRIGGERGH